MSVAVQPRPPTASAAPKMPAVRARPAKAAAKPAPAPTPVAASPSPSASTSSTSPSASTSGSGSGMPPPQRRPASLAVLAVPGKDTSSSSGKVFAKPSREWVLPERAKPGRKASTDEPENRRQSQNRLSQRAHRARRTDYIQTLEERLRKYEADEIHSNVRLQEVARALKADNDRMRNDVTALQAQLAGVKTEREAWDRERRQLTETVRTVRAQLDALRTAAASPTPRAAPTPGPTTARHTHPHTHGHLDERLEYELAALAQSPVLTPALTPRPAPTPRGSITVTSRTTTTASASVTVACPICPDPDPDCPCQQADARLDSTLAAAPESSPRCGLCDLAPDACLCHPGNRDDELDIKPIIPSRSPSPPREFRDDNDFRDCGLCTSESFCACRAGAAASSSSSTLTLAPLSISAPQPIALSIAPSALAAPLPPTPSATVAAPAMPLRLRKRPAAKQSVWSLDNVPAGQSRKEAVCTGDPSNCDACRNDSFGQEFCGNLFGKPHANCAGCAGGGCGGNNSSNATSASNSTAHAVSIASLVTGPVPSPRATSPEVQAPLVLACCGAPELCGHAAGCAGEVLIGPTSSYSPHQYSDTNPTNTTHNSNTHTNQNATASSAGSSGSDTSDTHEMMRPDEAWKALKAHPNSRYAPLAILADVVARRSACLGPRVELSPPPSAGRVAADKERSERSERIERSERDRAERTERSDREHGRRASASAASTSAPRRHSHDHDHAHSQPHSPADRTHRARAASVSKHKHEHNANGKRPLGVETSAVRDALRYLDSATPGPEPDDKRRKL